MVIRELLAILAELPPDAEVTTKQYTCGHTHQVPVKPSEVI